MAETGSLSKPAAKSLFTVFGVRMAAIMLDFVAAMFLGQAVRDYVFDPIGLSIADNLLVFGIPVFVLMNVAAIQNDRDLIYRTGYAVGQVQDLKIAVEDYQAAHARWPSRKSSDLGAATRPL